MFHCSCKGPGFGSQYRHSSSLLSIILSWMTQLWAMAWVLRIIPRYSRKQLMFLTAKASPLPLVLQESYYKVQDNLEFLILLHLSKIISVCVIIVNQIWLFFLRTIHSRKKCAGFLFKLHTLAHSITQHTQWIMVSIWQKITKCVWGGGAGPHF